MLDRIIQNGRIYDGSGTPPFVADIGIQGKRIACIGHLSEIPAAERIDVQGKNVLPGMIDVHTHTDLQFVNAPERTEALVQGITTEITGACGIGVYPLTHDAEEYLLTMRAIIGDRIGAFKSCEDYLQSLPPSGTNVAVQISHSPLRMETIGCVDRPLNDEEMKRMLHLEQEALEAGACGLSTGLAYYPASFGDTEEMVALCKLAARFDVPVSVHQRTALRTPCPAFDSRQEVLEFARRSGARLQYSHYRTTPQTAGQIDRLLKPIHQGLAEGLRITADFYPYPVGAGYATVVLPMWVMDGGFHATMRKLKNPDNTKKILQDMKEANPLLFNGVLTHCPKHPDYMGLSYRQIAKKAGQSIPELILQLLIEEELDVGYHLETDFALDDLERQELDFIALLKEPFYMLGSDTLPAQMKPHPRSYGAFAKMLRLSEKYGLDLALFANHVCKQPAELFGLKDRGIIREGAFADMFVFAPGQVIDHATFEAPKQFAAGIDLVMVNGKIAVRDGVPQGTLAGEKIRRNKTS